MNSNLLTLSINQAKDNWSAILILSALFLFSTKTLFNIPLTLMAIIGLYRLIKVPALIKLHETRLACLLFLCLWLPMLLALLDAEELYHSAKTTFLYVHFLFSCIFMIDELRKREILQKIIFGIFIIMTFFCFDAMLQFFIGKNLFGYPYSPPLLGGMFYPKNTLPHFLALLSPVYFEYIRRHKNKYWKFICLLIYLCILLLGGKRSAWIMFLSGGVLYAAYLIFISKTIEYKKLLAPAILIIFVLSTLSLSYPPLKRKLTVTSGLFSGNYETINKATANRLPIWETGLIIIKSHWLNGIGARGFRHAYADYADANNYFLSNGRSGQTHPHLTILEIVVETGIIGLSGYILFWIIFAKYASCLLRSKYASGVAWLITVMLAILPYNVHLAFYGSYWASAIWWVIPFFVVYAHHEDVLYS
ncbi:MAG: O-antigen ligase family protein [Proteobacteria bacterium]|nr:O-antigen ligase family protein [Pseudomonadota bacterium]